MRKIINIIIVIICIPIGIFSQSDGQLLFQTGNEAYEKENFAEAIKQYEKVIENGAHSKAIYLNLGNAHFKQDSIGHAILYYEKGLVLDPNDAKLLSNIDIAKQKVDSEIFEVPPFLPVRLWRSFVKIISPNIWALLQLLILSILVFFWYKKEFFKLDWTTKKYKRISRSLVGSILLLGFILWSSVQLSQEDIFGIALEKVQIQSGPDLRSDIQSNVQAGEKVKLLDTFDDWYKVELLNLETGYIQKNKLGII